MSKSLTKADIYTSLAGSTKLAKSQIASVWEEYFKLVSSEVKKGRDIIIPGIGKINVKHRPAKPARPGRNPATGESITIPAKSAHKVVKIRVAKDVKDLV
jgi:DNA-binding protein HU-beta